MFLDDSEVGFLFVQVLIADSDIAFIHAIVFLLDKSDELLGDVSLELQF